MGSEWGIRTFLVFLDLPKHLEFRAGNFPLLETGIEINLDVTLKDPHDKHKQRVLKGPYRIHRRVLKYSTHSGSKLGFSQYLEIEPSG